ncbi:MAG: ribonuclease III [Lachnospiraceae bacterium]|nr:ribonuclease III [Lachnospiraceae bacterium]
MKVDLKLLQEKIQYQFHNEELLIQALTHSSFSHEMTVRRRPDYERLEFLGDAVLELVSSEYIFHTYPQMSEGNMTKLRAGAVCEPALAHCANKLELGKFLYLGKGEECGGGRKRESIIADVMEAIVGAIFLDSGIEEAKNFIMTYILADMETNKMFYDSKSTLQEIVQKKGSARLEYTVLEEKGPEHQKEFVVAVNLNGDRLGVGTGKNKKAAEQKAAYEALLKMKKNK